MKKFFLNFWVYVYPFPATLGAFWYWQSKANTNFALFMILVPLLYGYIVPGYATNVLKKWRFHTPFRLGNYYAHHGFKITGNMNTWMIIAHLGTDLSELSPMGSLSLMVSTGCINGFIIWWHDIAIMKEGKLELFSPLIKPSMSPEEKVYTYGPLCFFLLGASFALASIIAYDSLVTQGGSLWIAIIWGYLLVSLPATLAFTYLEKRATRTP